MRLLAIDTATEYCSVAFSDGVQELSRGIEAPRQHANLILPFVQEVLDEAKVKLSALDGIIIGRGPGSFTGVRIAAGVGQGLAFSQNLPVVGVSSLQSLAQQAYRTHGATHVVAAIDARMGEVYFGTYILTDGLMQQRGNEIVGLPEQMVLPIKSQLSKEAEPLLWHGVGTGFMSYPMLAECLSKSTASTVSVVALKDVRLPCAQDMLSLGQAQFKAGKGVAAEQFEVHYVRNEVTWQKLPGRT